MKYCTRSKKTNLHDKVMGWIEDNQNYQISFESHSNNNILFTKSDETTLNNDIPIFIN